MSKNEDQEYRDKMLEEGVDVPELEDKPEEEPEENPEEPKEPEKDTEEPEPEHLQETKEKKRTIYDDYKEKKTALKASESAREEVEAKNVELQEKLDAFSEANTPKEKQEALDEIDEFAQSINADPEALRKMQSIFLKGVKPDNTAIQKDLKEFQDWKVQNQSAIQKQQFEDAFIKATPDIKELFTASSEEMNTIKNEIAKLSQEDEWKGKDIDYIAFKNKTVLSALVSPKKKGMESKGRQQGIEEISIDFDPNADFSKMTSAQQEEWMKTYNKMGKSDDGLMIDADGKMSIV